VTLRHQARRDNNSNATLWSLTPFTEARLAAVHLRCAYGQDLKSLSFCLAYVADVPDVEREWVKVDGSERVWISCVHDGDGLRMDR
jgi:hypothetical protein